LAALQLLIGRGTCAPRDQAYTANNRAARGGGCGVDRAVRGRVGSGRSGGTNVFVVASVATVSRDVIYTLIV